MTDSTACPIRADGRHRRLIAIWNYINECGPATGADMAEEMGVMPHAVGGAILRWRESHPDQRAFRIVGWRRYVAEAEVSKRRSGGGHMAPIWGLDDGKPDAAQPRAYTKEQISRRHYARNGTHVRYAEAGKRRARGQAARVPLWVAMLGGRV